MRNKFIISLGLLNCLSGELQAAQSPQYAPGPMPMRQGVVQGVVPPPVRPGVPAAHTNQVAGAGIKHEILELIKQKMDKGAKQVSCWVQVNNAKATKMNAGLQRLRFNIIKNNTAIVSQVQGNNGMFYIIKYTGLPASLEPGVNKVYKCPAASLQN